MAIINYYTKQQDSDYKKTENNLYDCPAEFVLSEILDGVPFRCYKGEPCKDNDITDNVSEMLKDGEFTIIESSGGGVGDFFESAFKFIVDPLGIGSALLKLVAPSYDAPDRINNQSQSANNSLSNRNNQPRPYQRVYDICGTVQSIPSDLMQPYKIYGDDFRQYEYGYYYVGRGYLYTPEAGITDGDTILSNVSGSGVAIYDPFTSPNNSAPRQTVGASISENLYITTRSNEVDGVTLLAPNEYTIKLSSSTVASLSGTSGTLTDTVGNGEFGDLYKAGDFITIVSVKASDGLGGNAVLDGSYTVISASDVHITVDASPYLDQWSKIAGGSQTIVSDSNARVETYIFSPAGFSDWVTISKIKPKRLVANFSCIQGLYKENSDGILKNSVTVELQYQYLDEDGNPYGIVQIASKVLTAKSRDSVGTSVYVDLDFQSAVRVRARRSSDKDLEFDGNVSDEVKFSDLYGQIQDTTPHYGDLTTVQTVRKQTLQATAIKQPQLKIVSTEMLYKYLGGGVYDTVRTANTQAIQSLIRIMQDPIIGGLTLTTENLDELLAVQTEIETYFGNVLAGQFCYTFDDATMTAQEIAEIISKAIFCTVGRPNNKITLQFERPQTYPEMVFTHRSKIGQDKWQRSFKGTDKYDSVELQYIDPDTNIKETIRIPETGGIKPNKIDALGVRNYQQAYWIANRARQRDLLGKISVSFTSTEEGIYINKGRMISVVDGSRVASYDGYIVAKDGFTLTLSQEVDFTPGDTHSIILKRRNGEAESITVTESAVNKRTVTMLSLPVEPIYTGNSATKTEFSFGNEARHLAQLVIPATIEPMDNKSVKITAYNYDANYYLYDGVEASESAYSSGYSDGYKN